MKRVRLVMNPISGDDDLPNPMKLPDIIAAIEAEGLRADLAFTKPDESPATIARQAVEEGYDMVVVGGGDGTVSEVAKGLINTSMPLGILPIGTYNNIARSLNLPINLEAACRVLARGQVKPIDVGQANGEHIFFEAAGVGLDATLFPIGEDVKGGRWGRILKIVQLTLGYQPQRIRLVFDRPLAAAIRRSNSVLSSRRRLLYRAASRRVRISALFVVIANGPYYGSSFTVAPDAIVDDGLLTISIFRDFSKWELLRHFWSISKGQYSRNSKIDTYHVAEVQITSDVELPVHVDGVAIGTLPATFKVLVQALNVLVPNADTSTYDRRDDPNPTIALPVTETERDESEVTE